MSNDLLIFFGTIPWVLFLMFVLYSNVGGKKHYQRRFYNLFLFVLVFAIIRYGIGYDYFSYKYLIESKGFDYEYERLEILPRYLIFFSRGIHYQFYFAVCSILTIWPVYYVSKRLSIDPLCSFTIYVLFPLFFLDSLSITRNAVAYSMVFLMYYYIYNKRYTTSFICFLIAIGFHVSSVVALLIYPIFLMGCKKQLHIILYLISFILPTLVLPFLTSHFANFDLVIKLTNNVEKEITETGGLLYYVFNAIAIVNLWFWKKLVAYKKDNVYYLSFINVGVVLWNTFLPIDPTTAYRLSVFFLLYLILLVPSFFYITKHSIMSTVVKAFFVLLFISSISLNIYAHYGMGRSMSNVPYQVFFLFPSDQFYHVN